MQRQPALAAGLWAELGRRQRKYKGEIIPNRTQDGKYGIDRR